MLDPVIQSAFVVIFAWLLKLAASAAGIALDEATLNTLAAAIVAFLLSKLGPRVAYVIAPKAVENGFLGDDQE